MIPDLASCRLEWLESAEISFALDGPRVTGLSFFFHDEAACSEFAAAESLDPCVMADEKWLRAKFSLLPRHWLKLHYDNLMRCGLSQYFHINPTLHYPITTIRCFLRRYGCSDIGIIEELLKPALEEGDTQWGLALKRAAERTIPRIFFRILRPLLSEVLTPFVRLGYLSLAAAEQYREWNERLSAGERVFISLDPTLGRLSSLDFCAVSAGQSPKISDPGYPQQFDYLKIRIVEREPTPVLTGYLPLSGFHGWVKAFGRQHAKASSTQVEATGKGVHR